MKPDRDQPGSFANEVLLLASGGAGASEVRASLTEAGLEMTVCRDVQDLCRRAREGRGVAVVAADSLTPASADRLARTLSESPRGAHAFAVVLVEADRPGPGGVHGLDSVENAILLPRPLPRALLASAVQFVLRLRRSERQLEQQKETLQERVVERTAEAERRAEQLRVLATELTRVEQRERRRLAQLLHDQLQQLLIASLLKLGTVRRRGQGEEFEDAVQQLETVLKEALEASRSLTVELSPPILYDAGLAAALEWLGRRTHEKYGLSVDVRADRRAEPADEEVRILLFQAVRELLFNVVKHGRTDRAQVAMTPLENGRVEIVVADAGVGFDPGQLAAGKASDGGFGLFNMRERLESIDGSLALVSSPGQGTRATIAAPRCHLPRAAQGVASGASALAGQQTHSSPDVARKIRVLLADDHDMVREGLATILGEESDIELVGEASDGQQAVQLAMRTKPDVVVMDITMPRLNGIEATRRVLAALPETRVIGLSMHQREDMETAMREAGAVAYLPKGDTTDRLIDAIRSAALN